MTSEKPLIVQGVDTLLLEVASPGFEAARSELLAFAELIKAPEHVHTYRVTALSIWNARAAGVTTEQIAATLRRFSRYPVPDATLFEIGSHAARFGKLRLVGADDGLVLESSDDESLEIVRRHREVSRWLGDRIGGNAFRVDPEKRGLLKLALVRAGFPPNDEAGYARGLPLSFALRDVTLAGNPFALRAYQVEAARAFDDARLTAGGSGVIVLPCGAGKTVVGLACAHALQCTTLVLCTSVTAARQWLAEALDKTTLDADQVGIYAGPDRALRPFTVATYQMLTHRRRSGEPMTNLEVFDRGNWGLIIYDEVHLLPAPVFQITAALQARRRLGLTATLVREDGHEDDVFALIGPKKADVPWRELERQGWVATARCTEMRVPMPPQRRLNYAAAGARQQFRMAAENPAKSVLVRALVERHRDDRILVMAMYVEQIRELAAALAIPVLTGSTSQKRRDKMFAAFRKGEIRRLAVSKIGSLALDLPEANVAIQVSGTFGSRQEEAQRLGRILRPKRDGGQAHFYSLVSAATVEQEYAMHRQRFLCEQGYEYAIADAEVPADEFPAVDAVVTGEPAPDPRPPAADDDAPVPPAAAGTRRERRFHLVPTGTGSPPR